MSDSTLLNDIHEEQQPKKQLLKYWVLLLLLIGVGSFLLQRTLHEAEAPRPRLAGYRVETEEASDPVLRGGAAQNEPPMVAARDEETDGSPSIRVRVVDAGSGDTVESPSALVLSDEPSPYAPLVAERVLAQAVPDPQEAGWLRMHAPAEAGWLVVRAQGYSDAVRAIGGGAAARLVVPLDALSGTVRGRVEDVSGQAIVGATVTVVPVEADETSVVWNDGDAVGAGIGHQQVHTDHEGRFAVPGRVGAGVKVFVQADGYDVVPRFRGTALSATQGLPAVATWFGVVGAKEFLIRLQQVRVAFVRLVDHRTKVPLDGGVVSTILIVADGGALGSAFLGGRRVRVSGRWMQPWHPHSSANPRQASGPSNEVVVSVLRDKADLPWPEEVTLLVQMSGYSGAVATVPLLTVSDEPCWTDVPCRWAAQTSPRTVVIEVTGRDAIGGRGFVASGTRVGSQQNITVLGRATQTPNAYEFGMLPDEDMELMVTDNYSGAKCRILQGKHSGYTVVLPPPSGILLRAAGPDGRRIYGLAASVRRPEDRGSRSAPIGMILRPWNVEYGKEVVPYPLWPNTRCVLRLSAPGYELTWVDVEVPAEGIAEVDAVMQPAPVSSEPKEWR